MNLYEHVAFHCAVQSLVVAAALVELAEAQQSRVNLPQTF
jgi:hypothetical protein